MAKRYRVGNLRRKPGMTGTSWGILICSAMLGGVVAGMVMTKVLPNVPWDTRGVSFTKEVLQVR